MTPLSPAADGRLHPTTEAEIAQLIRDTAQAGATLRVRGSGHSVAEAILPVAKSGTRELMLDRMIQVRFDDAASHVSVQAGCHLGMDPSDPGHSSTFDNGLFKQIDNHNPCWAVPDMGGIIHQSVGGFLSTGSAGGSLVHSIYDSIVSIRMIDGTGTPREFVRGRDPEFYGAVIAMGLLGVVVEVRFECIPRYHVRGKEVTTKLENAAVDLFGPRTLETWLRQTQHARLLWWPQHGVEKLVVWEGKKMEAGDYDAETGTAADFKAKPYELLDRILGRRDLPQTIANRVFKFFGRLNPPLPANGFQRLLDKGVGLLYSPAVNLMLKVNDKDPKRFWDLWWQCLPMDNEASDELLCTQFTELWIPIEHTGEVMKLLRKHYATNGWNATGTHACEIYAAKQSKFWLSPAYGKDVLRVDLFWFSKNEGRPEEVYYPQFWKLLDQFAPRYHWGKHLPVNPEALRSRYPRWDDFLALRNRMDPNGVFLTPYWKERLGV